MIIAVASNGLDIAPKFLQCENLSCYSTQSFKLADVRNMPTPGFSCEEHADLLEKIGADVLICGEIPLNCRLELEECNVVVIADKSGNALEAAQSYVDEYVQTVFGTEDDLAEADTGEDDDPSTWDDDDDDPATWDEGAAWDDDWDSPADDIDD